MIKGDSEGVGRDFNPRLLIRSVGCERFGGFGLRQLRHGGCIYQLVRPSLISSAILDPEAVTGEKDSVPNKAKLVFAENYPRLQQVEKRHDPGSIFHKWFPITSA
jgi:hypothetical protein